MYMPSKVARKLRNCKGRGRLTSEYLHMRRGPLDQDHRYPCPASFCLCCGDVPGLVHGPGPGRDSDLCHDRVNNDHGSENMSAWLDLAGTYLAVLFPSPRTKHEVRRQV